MIACGFAVVFETHQCEGARGDLESFDPIGCNPFWNETRSA